MGERIFYQDGDWVPESEAKVSIWNRGFTLGDAVYEALRTFNQVLFKNREHVDRLYRSMKACRMDPGLSPEEMEKLTEETVERNRPNFKEGEEMHVYTFVSRGPGGHPMKAGPCSVHIAPKLLNFKEFAKDYDTGIHLVVPSARRQPPQVWDAKIKTTSRVTHTLADIEAYLVDPDSYCLMLDLDGNVAENRSANFGMVKDGEIHVPTQTGRLQGISEMVIKGTIAKEAGIPFVERDIQVYDIYNADEAFLCSSSWCLIPVSRLNGEPIGTTKLPGPITQRLIDGFSKLAGFDIIVQAKTQAGIN